MKQTMLDRARQDFKRARSRHETLRPPLRVEAERLLPDIEKKIERAAKAEQPMAIYHVESKYSGNIDGLITELTAVLAAEGLTVSPQGDGVIHITGWDN
jgi:hypothetical protein